MSDSVRKRLGLWAAALAGGMALLVLAAGLVTGADAGTTTKAAVPQNQSPPTLSGTATEGQKLVGQRGEWSGKPTDYNDFWQRCDKDGGSCANISGAHDRNGYVLKGVDVGNTIRFKVQAKNRDGMSTASSTPTAVVAPASKPAPSGCSKKGGSIPVTGVSAPERLQIDQSQISPSDITHGTRELTGRFHITACGGSIEGALVYVTAVPYNQFGVPNEQPTGADGWATLQFSALSGYPVSTKQQLLVLFVRARKSGEPILGGISTRRLVSFRVTR